MTIFKNKKFLSIIAAAAIAVTSLNLPTVFASSADEETVDFQLVANTIKPTLMKEKFEANQAAQARATKLAEVKAEQQRLDDIQKAKEEAEAAAKAKAEKEAAEKKAAAQRAQAVTQAPTQQVSGVSKGQFKLSFYDPAVLGSSMGYGGVAANLSMFPRGTRLKITLSDGTVWYRVVNDTGSFAYANPYQLDVAMPSNMIPSAGILYANVEVI